MWSTGVIVFMLVTGGASPFYSRNKYKLARRSVRGNYDIEQFGLVLQKVPSELHPKVHNHGEGPY